MFLSINFDHAMAFLQLPALVREDVVIPAQIPDCVNSTYRAGYDWLYRYEREIAGFLERWLRPFRYDLIGEKGILCEALSNAFCHGHDKDARLPITVKVYHGGQGVLVQVADSGAGFDVQHILRRYLQKKQYYNTAGNGIHLMATHRQFGIFYDARGTAFHLLHAFHCCPSTIVGVTPVTEVSANASTD